MDKINPFADVDVPEAVAPEAPESVVDLERMKLWVQGLRNGEYAQGRLHLAPKSGDSFTYCCLGVACEVAIANGLEIEVSEVETDMGVVKSYDGDTTTLPDAVSQWYGLGGDGDVHLRYMSDPNEKAIAAELNDDHRLTFAEIANCIVITFDLEEEGDEQAAQPPAAVAH